MPTPDETAFVRRALAVDDPIAFDVGANVGSFALLMAHAGAEVHAFEPLPATYAILESNVAHAARINAHQIALSDKAGEGRLPTYPPVSKTI